MFILDQQNIVEGNDLLVTCNATPGNPSTTHIFWTLLNHPSFNQNEATLNLSKIKRDDSGRYNCTAENLYSDGMKGIHSQQMVVNVFCE